MSDTQATERESGKERMSVVDNPELEDVLSKIGPTAKRIMLAQPLNPFTPIKITIVPRGGVFDV